MSFRVKGHQSGTRANYRINQNMKKHEGKKWKAEVLFNEYQESRGMGLVWGMELPFRDPETARIWHLECDFLRPVDGGSFDTDYEVDGEKYHETKEVNGQQISAGKDAWKDRIKNANGIKVIHIPAAITEAQHWKYLDEMLPKAQMSKLASVVIPG